MRDFSHDQCGTAAVHVDASCAHVKFHCDQKDGRLTFRLHTFGDQVAVYVNGTARELIDFARTLAEQAREQGLAEVRRAR